MKSLVLSMKVAEPSSGGIRVNANWEEPFFKIPVQNRVYMLAQFIAHLTGTIRSINADVIPDSLSGNSGNVEVILPIEGESDDSDRSEVRFTGLLNKAGEGEKVLAIYACIQYLKKLGVVWVNSRESMPA